MELKGKYSHFDSIFQRLLVFKLWLLMSCSTLLASPFERDRIRRHKHRGVSFCFWTVPRPPIPHTHTHTLGAESSLSSGKMQKIPRHGLEIIVFKEKDESSSGELCAFVPPVTTWWAVRQSESGCSTGDSSTGRSGSARPSPWWCRPAVPYTPHT